MTLRPGLRYLLIFVVAAIVMAAIRGTLDYEHQKIALATIMLVLLVSVMILVVRAERRDQRGDE